MGGGQPRFDKFVGNQPAQTDNQQGRHSGEEIVVERVEDYSRVDKLGPGLGNPLQHGVNCRGDEIGREPAGDAGEGGGDARQGVAPRGEEDHPTQGYYQDISGIGGGMADNADQDDHGREQPARRDRQHGPQRAVNKAGVLRHPYAQHCHEHHPDGVEVGKSAHHIGKKRGHGLAGQLVDDLYRLAGSRVCGAEMQVGKQPGERPGYQQQAHKQHGRIRQPVAGALDYCQGALRKRVAWFRLHGKFPIVIHARDCNPTLPCGKHPRVAAPVSGKKWR